MRRLASRYRIESPSAWAPEGLLTTDIDEMVCDTQLRAGSVCKSVAAASNRKGVSCRHLSTWLVVSEFAARATSPPIQRS